MHIGVTKKVKKFEINPIFAKTNYSEKTDGGSYFHPHPLRVRGIGLINFLLSTQYLDIKYDTFWTKSLH